MYNSLSNKLFFSYSDEEYIFISHTIQIYSGITRGRMLNDELYTQRLQKLIYLYLSYWLFREDSLHSDNLTSVIFVYFISHKYDVVY